MSVGVIYFAEKLFHHRKSRELKHHFHLPPYVNNRIKLIHSNWLSEHQKILAFAPFDLIVSNPPYIAKTEQPHLPLTVSKYEPSSALFGGDDGLDHFRKISSQMVKHFQLLNPYFVIFEFGNNQSQHVKRIMLDNNPHLKLKEVIKEHNGDERLIVFENTLRKRTDQASIDDENQLVGTSILL